MSYSRDQRRKTIRRFKKQYGENWESYFRDYVEKLVEERLGPPIGTLQEILERRPHETIS